MSQRDELYRRLSQLIGAEDVAGILDQDGQPLSLEELEVLVTDLTQQALDGALVVEDLDETNIPRRPQDVVAEATDARGYREGWTPVQFLARQIAKMGEELGETAHHISGKPGHLQVSLNRLLNDSSMAFDDPTLWDRVELFNMTGDPVQQIQKELADMQVVLFNMAAAVEEITLERFDIVEAAMDKAATDILRGVRQ